MRKKDGNEKVSVFRIVIRIIIFLLLPISLCLQFLAARFPNTVENLYSRGFYRAISGFFSKYYNLFPFSVAEIIIYCIAVFVLFSIVILIKRLFSRNVKGFFSILLSGVLIFSSAYFVFMISWGLNYCRVPLEESLGYKSAEPTAEELATAVSYEIDSINELTNDVTYDENGVSFKEGGFSKISDDVNSGYSALSSKSELYASIFGNVESRPKPVLASEAMAYNGIEGIFIPFTYEPNVNVSTPEFMQPFNCAHESAHLKGFAREQEANFVSYLSCTESEDVYYRYSGHMAAYLYLIQALYNTDQTLWKEQVVKLSDKAANDFKAYSEYTDAHRSKISEVANKVNDSYLKSQGQQGVITYDMFVKLLCDKNRTEMG